jgi:hypothetical protein
MVETPLKSFRPRRPLWQSWLLAILAVGFILLMTLTGQLSETRQLARFMASGVLTIALEEVRQVTLQVGERTATFTRGADGTWSRGQAVVSEELRQHLNQAVLFMHTSGPVRVMQPADYADTPLQEFGLEVPRCSVMLADARQVVLHASFGAYNPQDLLQYMQLRSSQNVYLMSRFVGQAWEHLGEHLDSLPAVP